MYTKPPVAITELNRLVLHRWEHLFAPTFLHSLLSLSRSFSPSHVQDGKAGSSQLNFPAFLLHPSFLPKLLD